LAVAVLPLRLLLRTSKEIAAAIQYLAPSHLLAVAVVAGLIQIKMD
jgi:hypothetical protein